VVVHVRTVVTAVLVPGHATEPTLTSVGRQVAACRNDGPGRDENESLTESFSFKIGPVPLSSDQRLSNCENDPAEGTALYEVTESISRFCQRKGLSHDRFDRSGL
jgi:hypothetical protein